MYSHSVFHLPHYTCYTLYLINVFKECRVQNSLRQPDLQKCKSGTSQMSVNQRKHMQLQKSKLSLPCYCALWSCKVSTSVEFGGSVPCESRRGRSHVTGSRQLQLLLPGHMTRRRTQSVFLTSRCASGPFLLAGRTSGIPNLVSFKNNSRNTSGTPQIY